MSKPKRALITGISGQDGQFLHWELAREGREVFGFGRSESLSGKNPAPEAVFSRVDYHDLGKIRELLDEIRPDEIYHLASPSCIYDTEEFETEILHLSANVTGCFLRWAVDRSPQTRIFFASSSEIFGAPRESPQTEASALNPGNPYAIAKLAGQRLIKYFRERKGIFACTGILYNHESPRRRGEFVSRKITMGAAAVKLGHAEKILLGNLDAVRDWTHAQDFARAFRLALEADASADYILASGQGRTVREFCRTAFEVVGLDYSQHVLRHESFYRAENSPPRIGDISRAKIALGWQPQIEFEQMIKEMVLCDLEQAQL